MPRRALRTRSLRKKYVRTPGGKIVIHYFKKRPSPAKCAICRRELQGVPRLRPSRLRQLPKSSKRPTRPYGGTICSTCLQKLIKMSIREAT